MQQVVRRTALLRVYHFRRESEAQLWYLPFLSSPTTVSETRYPTPDSHLVQRAPFSERRLVAVPHSSQLSKSIGDGQ